MTPEALAWVLYQVHYPAENDFRPASLAGYIRLAEAALAALTPAPTVCSCACHLRCGTSATVSDAADHFRGVKEMVSNTTPPPPEPEGELIEALKEIAKGEGAFSRDPLKHAENTIENMKAIATAALARARGKG